jgi:hypothetical protein
MLPKKKEKRETRPFVVTGTKALHGKRKAIVSRFIYPAEKGIRPWSETPPWASCTKVHHWTATMYDRCMKMEKTYERTKRSRLSQSGFLGLKVMNLLKRTWATGAMPMGAPGWPELAAAVASTWRMIRVSN